MSFRKSGNAWPFAHSYLASGQPPAKKSFIKKPLVYPLQLNRGNTAFTLLQRKFDALAFG